MASVRVKITDRAIITALNTPGGGVFRWRDEVGSEIKSIAEATSPINDPENALHRGGDVGRLKASWDWDRRGSSGHHVICRVTNGQNHAVYVEWGRTSSGKMQIFSWSAYGGAIVRIGGPGKVSREDRPLSRGELAFNARVDTLPKRVGSKTAARAGEHILGKATVAVLGSAGIAARVDM